MCLVRGLPSSLSDSLLEVIASGNQMKRAVNFKLKLLISLGLIVNEKMELNKILVILHILKNINSTKIESKLILKVQFEC